MKRTLLNLFPPGGWGEEWLRWLALGLMLAGPCCTSRAATLDWTGNAVQQVHYWSNPANWSPSVVPQDGDTLSFIQGAPNSQFSANDLTNLVAKLLFGYEDATIYGNTITLTADIEHVWDTSVHIYCGLKLATNVVISVADTFNHNTGYVYLHGDIDLNGYQATLNASYSPSGAGNGTGKLYISGSITGSGQVRALADQGSYLEFNGPGNSFVGDLLLFNSVGASVVLNTLSGVANGNVTISGTPGAADVTYGHSDQFGDSAHVLVKAGIRLSLNGYSDTIGELALLNDTTDFSASRVDTAGGTLRIFGGINSSNYNVSVIPTISGHVDLLSGSHIFNVVGSYYAGLDMQATISGFGAIAKTGSSGLLLSASNTFNSSITIAQGPVDVRNDHGLGDTAGNTVIEAGSLVLRNVNVGDEWIVADGVGSLAVLPGSVLTSIGTSSCSGPISLNTNLVVSGGDMTFNGPISGSGGLGCFSGGTVELGGTLANTYTGPTIARSPLLQLNKPFDVRAFYGPLIVGDTNGGPYEVRWLQNFQTPHNPAVTLYSKGLVNLNNFGDVFGPITFNGGAIQTGSGTLNVNGPIVANPSGSTATISGLVYLLASPVSITVSNGVANPGLLIDAWISGDSPVAKQGPGTLTLSGINDYTGVTYVQEGIAYADSAYAFGAINGNTVVSDGATVTLGNFDGMIEPFQINGTGVAGTNGAFNVVGVGTMTGPIVLAPSTINVAFGAKLAINSVVSGVGPLTKTGRGDLYLGGLTNGVGNNTYSGNTVVNAGTLYLSKDQNVTSVPGQLVLGPGTGFTAPIARWLHTGTMAAGGIATVNTSSLLDLNGNNQTLSQLNLNDGGDAITGTGALSFTGGGSLNVGSLNPTGLRASSLITGKLNLPANDYLYCNVVQYGPGTPISTPELDVPAAISGAGNIYKTGGGAMRLTGNNRFDGTASVYSGEVDVMGGSIIAGSQNALGGTIGETYVGNGASLVLINGIAFGKETLVLNSTNSAALDNRGGTNTWTGPIQLLRDSTMNVDPDWALNISNVISGTGNLFKQGPGLLSLGGGTNNNTFSGDTFVNNGTVLLNKAAYYQAIPHNLIIGSGQPGAPPTLVRHQAIDQIQSSITINAGGLLDLGAFDEYAGYQDAIRLNGGGSIQSGTGTFYLADGANLIVNPVGATNVSTITGKFGLFPGNHRIIITNSIAGDSQFDLNIEAPISQFSTLANLSVEGNGRVHFAGANTFTGGTAITNATLVVDGSQPQSPVTIYNGRLEGPGIVGHITFTGTSGSTIAPGNGPGILSCSNFNASAAGGGKLEVELNGWSPGQNYDQLNVRGAVNLTGLVLQAKLGFMASTNQEKFIIIANDGNEPIIGTFTGLPEGAPVWAGSELFYITYTGGDGNDVVLTRQPTPAVVLHFERVNQTNSRCFWLTNYPTYHLEYTAALGTNKWTVDTNIPVINGSTFSVTNTAGDAQRFYRLSRLE